MPSNSRPPPRTWSSTLTVLAVVLAVLSAVFYYLDSHLEWFYILNPKDLHDLSLRAIGAHGNDTRSVVGFIVSELSEKLPGGYINLDEEWIFNNAGGAMGAMYIIHASTSFAPIFYYPKYSGMGCCGHMTQLFTARTALLKHKSQVSLSI
jgi:C-8 sterol isomerase